MIPPDTPDDGVRVGSHEPALAPFFADVGTVNRLARRGALSPGSQLYGKAFENWLFHELSACIAYLELDLAFDVLPATELVRRLWRGEVVTKNRTCVSCRRHDKGMLAMRCHGHSAEFQAVTSFTGFCTGSIQR